jgi:hypothetical protein
VTGYYPVYIPTPELNKKMYYKEFRICREHLQFKAVTVVCTEGWHFTEVGWGLTNFISVKAFNP